MIRHTETAKYDLYIERERTKTTTKMQAIDNSLREDSMIIHSRPIFEGYYKIFKELKETMPKEVKANMMTISQQIDNVKKEIHTIQENQIDILEMNSKNTQKKNFTRHSTVGLSRYKRKSVNLKIISINYVM